MNYGVDRTLDIILTKAMGSGIKSVKQIDGYYLDITFNDGAYVKIWNSNKYYAWLSIGSFMFPDREDGIYRWNYERPRRKTMARLYKMLKQINIEPEYKYLK